MNYRNSWNFNNNNDPGNNIVGNISYSDNSYGYREEIKDVIESYSRSGTDLVSSLISVIADPTSKSDFVQSVTESMLDSELGTNPMVGKLPFYNNYVERSAQLLDNSLTQIATESAMLGYAPIVAYNPFFLKKTWVENIFKDVLMTEVPRNPIINIGYDKDWLVDHSGNRYPLPDALYDNEMAKKLINEATGINFSDTPIEISKFKPQLNVLTSTYFPGLVEGDVTAELTPDIHVSKVIVNDSSGTEHEIPCDIRTDITTHNFVKGKIKYIVKNEDGTTKETIEDELVGNIDFVKGTISLFSKKDAVKKVCISGKLANRWNYRSLDVAHDSELIQKTMPESGPRFNAAIPIEEAADALVLRNIDLVADYADKMGQTIAAFEDFECKNFLIDSFNAHEKAVALPIDFNLTEVVKRGYFNALPFEGYSGRITEWMKESREYFERLIGWLKMVLKTPEMAVVAVSNPNLIRFLQDGINWVFTDDTQVSGLKLSYNFGVYTSSQDRVHVITSNKLSESDGIRLILIPLCKDKITFKHFVYNITIDRQYRHPVKQLVPNLMCTQRTLTFEVLPVQGLLEIEGRDLFSPETLRRSTNSGTSSGGTSATPPSSSGSGGGTTGTGTDEGGNG